MDVYLQQVDDKNIRTIHLHSSGGSGGSAGSSGKNFHRAKTLANNPQYRERHEPNTSSRIRTVAAYLAQSNRGE